ncbi:MAG: site-specific integrase [Nitrososphaerota archaeon]|nr:site-specific integrase [Nitrososphaerota archaeon]
MTQVLLDGEAQEKQHILLEQMSTKVHNKRGRSKYSNFVKADPNLQRWYSNLKRGSEYTADIYFRRLCALCVKLGTTPDDFQKLPQKKIEEMAQDYANKLEETVRPDGKRYAPQYIESNLKAIKSWAEWNDKKITKKIKIADTYRTPTLENEIAPGQQELASVLFAPTTDSRTRASLSLIAFAGCRPQVQGNKKGTDGLRIGDILDLRIVGGSQQKEVVFEQIPAQFVVRAGLSKTRMEYFNFLCEEACQLIKVYLDERIKNGEVLTPSSPVITVSPAARKIVNNLDEMEDRDPFLATSNISKHIRKAMRAVGIPYRPYVWRSYYDTRLMHAESEQLITHAYAQFFMGHKGDIERTYTLNKHKLPPDVMQGIKDSARRIQKVVQTRVPKEDLITVEEAKAIGKETWFLSLGFSKEEIQKLDLVHKEGEELRSALKQKLLGLLSENGKRQKVVEADEVKALVQDGWEYQATLPTGQCVVKLPDL